PISPYYFLLMIPPPPISTLFPYTTLFRSNRMKEKAHIEEDRFFVCASSCCPYNILELCCLDNITRGECEIRAEIFSSRTFDGLLDTCWRSVDPNYLVARLRKRKTVSSITTSDI